MNLFTLEFRLFASRDRELAAPKNFNPIEYPEPPPARDNRSHCWNRISTISIQNFRRSPLPFQENLGEGTGVRDAVGARVAMLVREEVEKKEGRKGKRFFFHSLRRKIRRKENRKESGDTCARILNEVSLDTRKIDVGLDRGVWPRGLAKKKWWGKNRARKREVSAEERKVEKERNQRFVWEFSFRGTGIPYEDKRIGSFEYNRYRRFNVNSVRCRIFLDIFLEREGLLL